MNGLSCSSISAVLPAYNEVAVIGDLVLRTDAALAAHGIDHREVIVVDDGSTDGTAARLEKVAASTPSVRVLRHPRNRGYGAALRTGFDAARMDWIWLMDADDQFDPTDISLLLAAHHPGSMVVGYRATREDPLVRRVNHAAFFTLVRGMLGPTVRDVNCAFKLFSAELGRGLRSDGAMVSTELVLRAQRAHIPVTEVAIPHHPRTTGQATGGDPRVVLRAFGELWRMHRHRGATDDRATPSLR